MKYKAKQPDQRIIKRKIYTDAAYQTWCGVAVDAFFDRFPRPLLKRITIELRIFTPKARACWQDTAIGFAAGTLYTASHPRKHPVIRWATTGSDNPAHSAGLN